MSPEEVATLIDGEGCISAYICNGSTYIRVTVEMTDPQYPQIMFNQFGGGLRLNKKKNPRHKDTHCWYVNNKFAEPVLMCCLPFLRLKKKQAEAALLMLSLNCGRGKKSDDADHVLRWRLYDIIKELNRKGKPQSQEVSPV